MAWSLAAGVMVLGVAVTAGCAGKEGASATKTAGDAAPVNTADAAHPVALSDVVSTSTTAPASSEKPFWPRFHGPKGDNLSADRGLLKEWPKSGPRLVWTAKGLGHGYASVTLANGLIYTAGNLDEKTVVTALDLEGKPRWQADNGPAWTRDYPGTRGTPTLDGDRVYHESPLGELTCYDAQSGKKIWDLNILREFGGQNITWALAESVLIDGDRLICCPGGDKASVAALDKKTGKTVWTAPSTGVKAGYASPVLAEDQGLRMILTMNAKAFLAVNADNGDLLCTYPHETAYDVNATSPIYRDGHVFLCSGYGTGSVLLKLTVQGRKASVEQVWKTKDLDNHHGGVIFLDGYLYGAAFRGSWTCLEWKTGKRMHAERGVGKGSLTFADGMLYTLSEQRDMGLVEATPKAHKVISRFKVPSGGEGPSWAHPVVCGGRLYVRHSDQLYAYDVRAKE